MMPEKEPPSTIRLCFPSLSLTVPLKAREEDRLDLGSIARAFGLEPWSVRLNGYFISRGADMVSSSVTWKSLQQLFSSKGLSTGEGGGGPVIVGGKLLKGGSKRPQDPEGLSANSSGRSDPQCKKLKCRGSFDNGSESRTFGLKRKHLDLPEEVTADIFKRLKINQDISDSDREANKQVSTIPSRALSCGLISENMKRQCEDGAIAAASVKRVR